MSIRTMIVDYKGPAYAGLFATLNMDPEFEVISVTPPDDAVLEVVEQWTHEFSPHVVITDSSVESVSSIEVIERVKTVLPSASVLVISTEPDSPGVVETLQAGASGYLALSELTDGVLRDAVRLANEGHVVIPARILAPALTGLVNNG